MDDHVHARRLERAIDGQRLEHVGLDRRDVVPGELSSCVAEDVRVRVEECDGAAIG
jgi:hypothetical protein